MPGRKGVLLREHHIRGARITTPINVGETNTIRMMGELGRNVNFASGKLYIRRGALGGGKEKAQPAFFKPLFGPNMEAQNAEGVRAVRIMDRLRERGLPVPKAGIIEHNGSVYLAMSPYVRKGGSISKFIPINTRPGSHTPHMLASLSAARDSALIRQLGRDTAEILNAGIYTKYFDFFGFYRKKDGSLNRFIMDVDYFYDMHGSGSQKDTVMTLFKDIKSVWKPRKNLAELQLFASAMKKGLESPELRAAVDAALASKSRGFFGYMREIFSA